MSDRQQIRKNEAAGYQSMLVAGPDSDDGGPGRIPRRLHRDDAARRAAERYFFDAAYFEMLLGSPQPWLLTVRGPDGDTAAAALARRAATASSTTTCPGPRTPTAAGAPSKNLIVAATDFAEELGLPLNLGGGLKPGDGLEEFKRGFANSELPWRTHEMICDRRRLRAARAGRAAGEFFPAYRAPAA